MVFEQTPKINWLVLDSDVKKECDNKIEDETKVPNKTSDVEKQPVIDSEANEQAMFDRAVALSLESFEAEMKSREGVSK